MHIGVVLHLCGNAFLTDFNKLFTHIDLTYIILVLSVTGLGSGEQSDIRVLPLLEKSSCKLHRAAAIASLSVSYINTESPYGISSLKGPSCSRCHLANQKAVSYLHFTTHLSEGKLSYETCRFQRPITHNQRARLMMPKHGRKWRGC